MAATALAACSTYGKKPDATATTTTAAWATDSSAPAQPAVDAVAKTSNVPVGSGVIVGEIVVTQPHLNLLSDPDSFSLTQRAGRMGPVTLSELIVGSDMSMDCGELCNTYRVIVLQSGRTECVHRGSSVSAGPCTAAVYAPEGTGAARWEAGSKMICFKIDRCAVDDALSDALGRQVTSQIDFTPVMPITAAPTRSWINMLLLFKEQLFRPNSLLNQPLVGLPFADSLVCGFLLAADHSHRNALTRDEQLAAPRTIRIAVEIIEEESTFAFDRRLDRCA